MYLHSVQDLIARHGVQATLHDLAYRTAHRFSGAMVLKGIVLTMDSVDRSFLDEGAGLRFGFIARGALERAIEAGAAGDMDLAFLDDALRRGDRCHGAFDGDLLASYGWYSTRPTPVNGELVLRFDRAYAYMYKGYTLPAYRGRRLHGIGMARALAALAGEGQKGLVSHVRSNNFDSLRSCYRLGYRDFGRVFAIRLGGRYRTFATRGCAAYGFRVEPMSP